MIYSFIALERGITRPIVDIFYSSINLTDPGFSHKIMICLEDSRIIGDLNNHQRIFRVSSKPRVAKDKVVSFTNQVIDPCGEVVECIDLPMNIRFGRDNSLYDKVETAMLVKITGDEVQFQNENGDVNNFKKNLKNNYKSLSLSICLA